MPFAFDNPEPAVHKRLFTTCMGGWEDMICNYGNIARLCQQEQVPEVSVLYYGDIEEVDEFLLAQYRVNCVVRVTPTSDRNHLHLYTLATQTSEPSREWLTRIGSKIDPKDVRPTHTTLDLHRNPRAYRIPPLLPMEVEQRWAFVPNDTVLLHPHCDWLSPSAHWQEWMYACKFVARHFSNVYLSAYSPEAETYLAGYNNVKVLSDLPMIDLFAIADRCRMVITTSDALAHWAVATRKTALVVADEDLANRPYYFHWLDGEARTRLVNVDEPFTLSHFMHTTKSLAKEADLEEEQTC